MISINYYKILKWIEPLNNSIKRNLLNDISVYIKKDKNNNENVNTTCPHCDGKNIVKNGKNKGTQRYLCKSCRKSFMNSTNTPMYYSKKDATVWIDFVQCLKKQYSIRKTAKCLNISISTAFFWRHKILDALREKNISPTLKHEVLCDKVPFGESFKGNHKNDNFLMPRKPYNNTTITTISKISRQRIFVLTLIDSNDNCIIKPVSIGKPSSIELIKNIGSKIEMYSELQADLSYSYKILASFCKLKLTNKIKDDSIEEKMSSLKGQIRAFFKPYRGVATKYLSNYLALFKYKIGKLKLNDSELHLIRGEHSYVIMNFKGRLPVFE